MAFLILKNKYCAYHAQKLELTLNKLKGGDVKCNIERYFFGQTEMEYLGFRVTQKGVKLNNNKI